MYEASAMWRQTCASRRRHPETQSILEGQHGRQETAVLGPDLHNGFSPPLIHDGDESKCVKHGVEVHALANHVDGQQEAGLHAAVRESERVWQEGKRRVSNCNNTTKISCCYTYGARREFPQWKIFTYDIMAIDVTLNRNLSCFKHCKRKMYQSDTMFRYKMHIMKNAMTDDVPPIQTYRRSNLWNTWHSWQCQCQDAVAWCYEK